MTEEIINADGSRNWQVNILLDNIKRLEQENKELKEIDKKICEDCEKEIKFYWDAFEEIKNIILTYESKEWNCFNEMDVKLEQISKVINEVIGEK